MLLGSRRLLWIGQTPESYNDEPARLRSIGFDVCELARGRAITPTEYPLPDGLRSWLCGLDLENPQVTEGPAVSMNAIFDVVVVCNSPKLTNEILRAFDGTIVARVHGCVQPFGDELFHLGCFPILRRRKDFHYVVHASHVTAGDNYLPAHLATVAPGWLDNEVLKLRNTWCGLGFQRGLKRSGIVISAPVRETDSYSWTYNSFLDEHFRGSDYEVIRHIDSVASEDYKSRLARFGRMQEAAGYLYAYNDQRQIHMAALEMIRIGGPVIYFSSSALAQQMPKNAPGEVRTVDEAHAKCKALLEGNEDFVGEVLDAQRDTERKLNPTTAMQQFDSVFSGILSTPKLDYPGISASAPNFQDSENIQQVRRMMRSLAYQMTPSNKEWVTTDVVTSFYHLILDRDPDESGLLAHAAALAQGASPIAVLANFLNSAEVSQNVEPSRFLRWLDAANSSAT